MSRFLRYPYLNCLKYVYFVLLYALRFLPLRVLHKSVSCAHWIKNKKKTTKTAEQPKCREAWWVQKRENREPARWGKKIITDWMNLLKWHVCVCSVLLCISVRSAAATHLGNPASQSISQPRPCCPSLSFSLSLRASFAGSCLLHKAISFSRVL